MPPERIKALDGWRAISILLVVAGHLWNFRYLSGPPSYLVFYLAEFGVRIFFVISGFIITTLALREQSTTGHFSILGFYGRRAFRILPPFYAYLASLLIMSQLGAFEVSSKSDGTAAAFLCNVKRTDCDWLTVHSWSLAFEQQFYLLFPLVFATAASQHKRLPVLFGIVTAAASIAAFVWGVESNGLARYLSFFSYISAGAAFASARVQLQRFRSTKRSRSVTALALCLLAVIVVCFGVGRLAEHLRNPTAFTIEMLLTPTILAWLIVQSIESRNAFSRVLEWPIVRGLGKISFSLYMGQQVFTSSPSVVAPSPFFIPPTMLLAAILSYHVIEKPMMRLGRRLFPQSNGLPQRMSQPGGTDAVIPRR